MRDELNQDLNYWYEQDKRLRKKLAERKAEIGRLKGLCQDYHAEADNRDTEIAELTFRLARERKSITHLLNRLKIALKDTEHLQAMLDESPHSFRCPEGLRYGRGDIPAVCTCHKSKSRGERDTEIERLRQELAESQARVSSWQNAHQTREEEINLLQDKITELNTRLSKAMTLINEQAEDSGLWFQATTASEAYLQQSLRLLTDAVEGLSDV